MNREAFFTLHSELPREGPGEPADVAWACETAGVAPDGIVCDAGCGPGADLPALLAAVPAGRVVAVEAHAPFLDAARARLGPEPRVDLRHGDMREIGGPYDLIWCAGALYFLGVTEGLTRWRASLRPGGAVAFSEACWFVPDPSPQARAAWAAHPQMTDEGGIAAQVRAAGYETVATRRISDAAWRAYYVPMQARVAALRDGAAPALAEVVDAAQAEIDAWRAHCDEFGYLLSVVRPA